MCKTSLVCSKNNNRNYTTFEYTVLLCIQMELILFCFWYKNVKFRVISSVVFSVRINFWGCPTHLSGNNIDKLRVQIPILIIFLKCKQVERCHSRCPNSRCSLARVLACHNRCSLIRCLYRCLHRCSSLRVHLRCICLHICNMVNAETNFTPYLGVMPYFGINAHSWTWSSDVACF